MGSGFGMGAGMWLFWLVLIALIVWVVYLVVGRSGPAPGGRGKTPLEILKHRLANGEIDEEEYQRLRRELQN